jgi:fecR protein
MDNFKDNETDIRHLIISSLEGTASEEELLVLQKWLEESEQHFLLFHAYRQDWIQAGCVQRYQTEEAWKKVERRLFHRMPVKHLFLWTRIAGYAALVVLMIAAGYVFIRRDQDKNRAYVVEGNIEPGGKKAILVLGSDEKVVLGDEAEETLLAGNMTVKKEGNTLVYDRQKNGEGEEEYNRLITPRGGEYAVVLADGTKVWVNAESELRYPVQFSGTERKVYLKGEAYFAVTKQVGKPFVVCVGDSRITVLGTEFNVRNYQDEVVATTLVKGAVRIHDAGRECDLLSGQQAVIETDGIRVREVDTDLYTAWKDGYFIYREKTLEDIMKELSRWYDFTYDCQSEELKRMTLTAKLRKFDRVEDIFDILKRTGRLDFVTHGKNVTVLAK